jgi:hypothetical protein
MKLAQVYCILLNGEPFLLERDGKKYKYGFHRNEYVLSQTEDKAVAVAKERALKKLSQKTYEGIPGEPIELKVIDIKTGMPIWRLLRNEGFIFYGL